MDIEKGTQSRRMKEFLHMDGTICLKLLSKGSKQIAGPLWYPPNHQRIIIEAYLWLFDHLRTPSRSRIQYASITQLVKLSDV